MRRVRAPAGVWDGPLVGVVISNHEFRSAVRLALGHRDGVDMSDALRRLRPRPSPRVDTFTNIAASQMKCHIRRAMKRLTSGATLVVKITSHGAVCRHGHHFIAGTDWNPDECHKGAMPLQFVEECVAKRVRGSARHPPLDNVTLVLLVNTCRTRRPCRQQRGQGPRRLDVTQALNAGYCRRVISYACSRGTAPPE